MGNISQSGKTSPWANTSPTVLSSIEKLFYRWKLGFGYLIITKEHGNSNVDQRNIFFFLFSKIFYLQFIYDKVGMR